MDRFNLGTHARAISTASAEAQRWFNLGLNWCFGFNKNEAIKCFHKAIEFDPRCMMAHWGIAYGSGPFYNLTWREHGEEEANASARTAFEHLKAERAMRSADMLAPMCPDAGHLNHMPGHVYMLCGDYQKAKAASEKAIAADD